MYVDLDNVSEVGLVSAILHNKKGVIIINKKNKRKNIVRLLNTYPDFYVVESVQHYAEMMLDSLETI